MKEEDVAHLYPFFKKNIYIYIDVKLEEKRIKREIQLKGETANGMVFSTQDLRTLRERWNGDIVE